MALGREEYVKHMIEKLHRENIFSFDAYETEVISEYKAAFFKQVKIYANIAKENIINFAGHKAAYVEIFDKYKNDIAEQMRTLKTDAEFLVMPVLDRESVSLRNINPEFDVSKIAQQFGGGGHIGAASIPKENAKAELQKALSEANIEAKFSEDKNKSNSKLKEKHSFLSVF